MDSRTNDPIRALQPSKAAITIGAIALAVVVTACSSSPTPTPMSTLMPGDRVAAGARLFVEKGCATCHGQNAEGTGVAPALPGHTEEQVRRQVRNPVGRMPAFNTSQVSDEELERIADYIVSLGPGDGEHDGGHMEPMDMGHEAMMEMHHWMALEAVQVGNVADANHHIDHINELTDDAEYLHQIQEIVEAMHAGNMHDAEHMLEGLLADRIQPSLDMPHLHARMAIGALTAKDVEDARHHLQHIIDLGGNDEFMEMAESAIMSLDAGDRKAAEHTVGDMLEIGTH